MGKRCQKAQEALKGPVKQRDPIIETISLDNSVPDPARDGAVFQKEAVAERDFYSWNKSRQ